MRQVDEFDILQAISDVSCAIGAIDTVADFVDSRPASVLRKYRGHLANTLDDMCKWLEDRGDDD